ncbi:MAG: ATP-binding protein [Patescibacteria group bacterium]|jgi:hypothetical protein
MYIKRKIESKILKYLNSPEIIAILGPRQSGKTTVLRRIFESLNSASFISFEDREALGMFEKDIENFISAYVKNKRYLFIDEFQYARAGGKKLKYIFDSHKIKIFISGSSSVDLAVNALKYLVGRIFIFNLYPLDFEEFIGYREKGLVTAYKEMSGGFKALTPVKIGDDLHAKFARLYEEYAIYGGYPRVVLSKNDEEKKEVLKNIYNTYFLREVKDILGLIDDYKLEKLLKGLALQIGNLIEYNELGRLSEYSYPTLKRYINFFEKTFISKLLPPFYKNKRKEIVKNPKVYFFDCGLRNFAANDFRRISERPDGGALLENAVFQQLIKGEYSFNYWRDKYKNEMDFILNLEGGKIAALEIKSRLKNPKLESARNFKKYYPEAEICLLYFNPRGASQDKLGLKFYPVYAV